MFALAQGASPLEEELVLDLFDICLVLIWYVQALLFVHCIFLFFVSLTKPYSGEDELYIYIYKHSLPFAPLRMFPSN